MRYNTNMSETTRLMPKKASYSGIEPIIKALEESRLYGKKGIIVNGKITQNEFNYLKRYFGEDDFHSVFMVKFDGYVMWLTQTDN